MIPRELLRYCLFTDIWTCDLIWSSLIDITICTLSSEHTSSGWREVLFTMASSIRVIVVLVLLTAIFFTLSEARRGQGGGGGGGHKHGSGRVSLQRGSRHREDGDGRRKHDNSLEHGRKSEAGGKEKPPRENDGPPVTPEKKPRHHRHRGGRRRHRGDRSSTTTAKPAPVDLMTSTVVPQWWRH